MTEKTVNTIAGPFDRKRLAALKETIADQEPDAVVQFEGKELLAKFGQYLAEFVEVTLGQRNTEGL